MNVSVAVGYISSDNADPSPVTSGEIYLAETAAIFSGLNIHST
jgi:hypothetical protein